MIYAVCRRICLRNFVWRKNLPKITNIKYAFYEKGNFWKLVLLYKQDEDPPVKDPSEDALEILQKDYHTFFISPDEKERASTCIKGQQMKLILKV